MIFLPFETCKFQNFLQPRWTIYLMGVICDKMILRNMAFENSILWIIRAALKPVYRWKKISQIQKIDKKIGGSGIHHKIFRDPGFSKISSGIFPGSGILETFRARDLSKIISGIRDLSKMISWIREIVLRSVHP